MSLPSFLPPTARVCSLAWSSAWKLTAAQKVSQVFTSFCRSFFSPPLCLFASLCFSSSVFPFYCLYFLFSPLICSFPTHLPTLFHHQFFSLWLSGICPSPYCPLLSCHLFVYTSLRLPSFFFFYSFRVSLDVGRLKHQPLIASRRSSFLQSLFSIRRASAPAALPQVKQCRNT